MESIVNILSELNSKTYHESLYILQEVQEYLKIQQGKHIVKSPTKKEYEQYLWENSSLGMDVKRNYGLNTRQEYQEEIKKHKSVFTEVQ